jgi:2-iminobutanoate/2-iminopropanoate deaminase
LLFPGCARALIAPGNRLVLLGRWVNFHPMNNQLRINPKELYDGTPVGLSQAVVDLKSGLVFVSGQVDWNLQHQVCHDSIPGQFAGALEKLKIALSESGASVDGLLQLRVFIRGELEEHLASIVPVLASFLGTSRPAITAIGVASLASKATLVEVEAIARVN